MDVKSVDKTVGVSEYCLSSGIATVYNPDPAEHENVGIIIFEVPEKLMFFKRNN